MQKGFLLVSLLLGVVIITIALGFIFYQKNIFNLRDINGFGDCFVYKNTITCTTADGKSTTQKLSEEAQVNPTANLDAENIEGQFCGGIAGKLCPSGYECKLDGNYPDASGKCVR